MTKENAVLLLAHFKSKGMTKQVDEILARYPDLAEKKAEVKLDGKKSKR